MPRRWHFSPLPETRAPPRCAAVRIPAISPSMAKETPHGDETLDHRAGLRPRRRGLRRHRRTDWRRSRTSIPIRRRRHLGGRHFGWPLPETHAHVLFTFETGDVAANWRRANREISRAGNILDRRSRRRPGSRRMRCDADVLRPYRSGNQPDRPRRPRRRRPWRRPRLLTRDPGRATGATPENRSPSTGMCQALLARCAPRLETPRQTVSLAPRPNSRRARLTTLPRTQPVGGL